MHYGKSKFFQSAKAARKKRRRPLTERARPAPASYGRPKRTSLKSVVGATRASCSSGSHVAGGRRKTNECDKNDGRT
jgi:hypothetical protein